jgi:glutamate racemase
LFDSVVSRFAEDTRVIARPCPGLADLIEHGSDEAVLRRELAKHLEPFRDENVDQIVLGCTHYSLIGNLISELAGTEVVDPAPAVAAQIGRVVSGIPTTATPTSRVRLLTTGDPGRYLKQAAGILGERHPVERIDI